MPKKFALFLFLLLPALAFAQEQGPSLDFQKLKDDARENLINLVNIDTSHPDPQETNAVRYIYNVLNKQHIDWDVYSAQKNRANLIARLKAVKDAPAQKPLLLISHLDTAPVQEGWTMPPAKAALKDERVYGLGSADAKNYAAINLALLTFLKDNEVKLNRDIIFLFTADEEQGSGKGLKFLYDKYPDKFKAAYALNEGGGIIKSSGAQKPDILFVENGTKMYLDILLSAKGEAGHSSSPSENNAIYRLSQALNAIENYPLEPQITPEAKRFFDKISALQDDDAKTTIALLNSRDKTQALQAAKIIGEDTFFQTQIYDVISPVILTAGAGQSNVISNEAQATLNCRLLPSTNPEDFFNRLSALFEDDENISLSVLEMPEMPFPKPPDAEQDVFFKAVENAATKTLPNALVVAGLSPASSESEFLRRHGVITYGIGPLMQRAQGGPHQPDENIALEDFYSQLMLTTNIVLDFAALK